MKIVTCFKIIYDEQEIEIGSQNTLDMSKASLMISPYDCNAIEAAVKLAESVGDSKVIALTAGGSKVENSKLKKAALSRGPAEMVAVKDELLDSSNSYVVALALKNALEKIGDVDLVVCGEGSGDMYSQQTGNLIGALMGIPAINAVSNISCEGNCLVVDRSLEDCVETLKVELPAVITVSSDICTARIPSMKDILGAGKKPVSIEEVSSVNAAEETKLNTVSLLAPEQTERKQVIVKGDSDEAVQEFFENIRKELD